MILGGFVCGVSDLARTKIRANLGKDSQVGIPKGMSLLLFLFDEEIPLKLNINNDVR